MNEGIGRPTPEDTEFNTDEDRTAEQFLRDHMVRSLREIKEGATDMNIAEQVGMVLEDLIGPEALRAVEFDHLDDEEILGLTFTVLIENGIDDPEEFLKEKGVLE